MKFYRTIVTLYEHSSDTPIIESEEFFVDKGNAYKYLDNLNPYDYLYDESTEIESDRLYKLYRAKHGYESLWLQINEITTID
jgi:hypothetical protein